MTIDAYLMYRFLHSNHTKYHKYCKEWISNVTDTQIAYFIKEKTHLNL